MARLPDMTVQKIVKLYREGRSFRDIGRELKLHHSTVGDAVKKYAGQLGLGNTGGEPPPTSPHYDKAVDKLEVDGSIEMVKMERPATVEELMTLCKLDKTRWIPQYFKPNSWQGFCKVNDGGEIRKVQLYQSKAVFKRIMTEELEEAIITFARENIRPLPKPSGKKKKDEEGFAVSWGLWDAHIGMYAWQAEVGADYDVGIACNRIFNSIDDMIKELKMYPISKIWMPIGNDFMHFDSVRMRTAFGEHYLDTDTRYGRVYLSALKCLAYMVERAMELCDNLDLIYVPGNHDLGASYGLCVALAQRYRNDARIKVDLSPSPRKYRTHGGVILGFDHGNDVKPNQYPLIFGQEAKEHWSNSTYREVQIGHTHQRKEQNFAGVIPANGLLVRTNPALCNTDSWHYNQGLLGEPTKSVEAWRYDKVGYRGSHVAWARDDKNSKIGDFDVV